MSLYYHLLSSKHDGLHLDTAPMGRMEEVKVVRLDLELFSETKSTWWAIEIFCGFCCFEQQYKAIDSHKSKLEKVLRFLEK